MLNKPRFLLVIAALLGSLLACDGSTELPTTAENNPNEKNPPPINLVPRGNRRLEIDITDAENGDYDQSIALVKDSGAESVSLSVFWDEIETSPGIFNPDPNWLEISNLYYPGQDIQLSLVISVLDTTEIRLPSDLAEKFFSDPEIISRFRIMLDYIKSQIPDLKLTSLAIGNEIDGVLGNNSGAWEQYSTFFAPAAEYARKLWPGIPVGTKIMFEGLTGSTSEYAWDLNLNADAVMVTYYPLAGDFSVKDPEVILEDFNRITEMYPDNEIHFAEIGYPTSETNNSSPEQQAAFIHNMFLAWDEHASQVTVLSYSWLTDLPQASVKEYEDYYGLTDPAFAEFLRTLGLRTYPGSGEDKLGFQVFQAEAKARGW
jgi:hypothetical protein